MTEASASNFSHLRAHDKQLGRLEALAERYLSKEPNALARQGAGE